MTIAAVARLREIADCLEAGAPIPAETIEEAIRSAATAAARRRRDAATR